MNTNSKMIASFGVTVAAALLLSAGPAVAGGQMHVMSAFYGKSFPAYEIKIVSMPTIGTPLTVQLVDGDTGKVVTNAYITMQHTRWLGIKGVPQFQHVQLSLIPDGRGHYVCTNEPSSAGDKIVLRAQVPGDPSATWLTVGANI